MFGGISGALVPVNLLPGWAQMIAPIAPQYWAMRGFTAVFLDDAGVGASILPCAVLLGLTAIMAVVAITRFRLDEPNVERVRSRAVPEQRRADLTESQTVESPQITPRDHSPSVVFSQEMSEC